MSSINVKPTLKLDTSQSMPPPSNTENPKPKLKLNTGSRQSSVSGDAAAPTPSSEKIKINIKKMTSSQPGTPAATSAAPTSTITKSKSGRTSKPTKKLIESKKRGFDSDDEDRPLSVTRQESNRPNKMIKIKHPTAQTPGTPINSIKFKPRGSPVGHRPGDGYDSEASDREADPLRESTFILRAMPGKPAQYLNRALRDNTIGLPKQNGGADFGVQFLDAKQRRAMVTIDGAYFAAVLVHLPTITEVMKTWDRRNIMKNSDVSEMLLCFQEVKSEAEAKTVPLPPMVLKNDHKWPHGLTPPMHDAVHQRFRKTLSEKQWQSSASRVTKLLEDDAAALESHVEFLQDEDGFVDSEEDEEDAEGEIEQEYFGDQPEPMEEDEEDDEMLAAMEAALNEDRMQIEEPVAATPNMSLEALEAPTPMTMEAITPAPVAGEIMSEEDEDEDEEDDDEDDDEDDGEEVDEEELVAERERKEKLDEIEHLNKAYEDTLRQLSEVNAPILKRRILTTKANLEKEISVKKAALGLTDED
ncbi:TAFII55 protein conserved region-domain-containing protein [Annulohypoxylon bovei var. microspora]|nr:TAFII55 protein conserved region-domain-containing protein [Annulohypoxylon bovei var. microspora]